MNITKLISKEIEPIYSYDNVDSVLHIMEYNKIYSLPVFNSSKQFIGNITESRLLDVENKNLMFLEEGKLPLNLAKLNANKHVLDGLKIFALVDLDCMSVFDDSDQYQGLVLLRDIQKYWNSSYAVSEEGAIIDFMIEPRNYSLSEISRICESNDIKIVGVIIHPQITEEHLIVTIKVNTHDILPLLATFERYAYYIQKVYSNTNDNDYLKERFDNFLNFLNV